MMTHELKTWPEYFESILTGEKTFEIRKNDRDFKRGDILILREWSPETEQYTGRYIHRVVTYILDPKNALNVDFGEHVIMSIK